MVNLHADTVIGHADIALKKVVVSGQRPRT
jgi:hypothetical protein